MQDDLETRIKQMIDRMDHEMKNMTIDIDCMTARRDQQLENKKELVALLNNWRDENV